MSGTIKLITDTCLQGFILSFRRSMFGREIILTLLTESGHRKIEHTIKEDQFEEEYLEPLIKQMVVLLNE